MHIYLTCSLAWIFKLHPGNNGHSLFSAIARLVRAYLIYVMFNSPRLVMWKMKQHSTHWGRLTHICVSKLTIIGSENGLSPVRRQAIIWLDDGILLSMLSRPLGTNLIKILIENYIFLIQESAFQNVWKLAALLSTNQCVSIIYAPHHFNIKFTSFNISNTW